MNNLASKFSTMPRLIALFSLISGFAFFSCQRQTPAVPVSNPEIFVNFPNIRIDSSAGPFATGPCEPSIAISPIDSNIVVAGAILDKVYYSSNGGITWKKKTLTS